MPQDIVSDMDSIISARSANEMVSYQPGFWVNASLYVFGGMILLMLASAFLIPVTDAIEVEVKLTSVNAPKPVVAQEGRRLVKLLLHEGDFVQAGSVIGFLETTANAEVVIRLDSQIRRMADLFYQMDGEGKLPGIAAHETNGLGELQHAYQTLINQYLVYKSYSGDGFFVKKLALLQKDIVNRELLREKLKERQQLINEDLVLEEKTFAASTWLKNDKVVSEAEYRAEQSRLIGKKVVIPELESLLIANSMEADEKRKEILELAYTIQSQKTIFYEALNSFVSQLGEWKKLHLLIAPSEGVLAFPDFLQEHQMLMPQQVVCFVKTAGSSCFAEVLIPQKNFGKVAVGQSVQLYFQAYPYQDYGFINTHIAFISGISSDSGFMAKLKFTDGLTTSLHKTIPYIDDLKASGKIIVRRTKLIHRLLHPLRNAIAAL
ncbi:HlyD family secretion protein [Filimonas zeae]|uniref:HlyD family secretion protein n=1 Tax=Filimonas zeae TaxID=1737353 RepID=A0A917IRG4_9BACT|nr:hypothetical protein [Filimonas zeae]MDR6338201.1 HlyD family secretion protein [Filimonas zeae]GGH62223.1 hypothetical protein GCM10011379_11970 [Filimonas zeae]